MLRKLFNGPMRAGWYLLYYLVSAVSACAYGSFLMIYLEFLGYNAVLRGLFSTIPSLAGLLLQPILAAMTDKTRHKLGAMVALVTASIACMGIMFVFRPETITTPATIAHMSVQTLYSAVFGAANSLNTAVLLHHLTTLGKTSEYSRLRIAWTAGYAVGGVAVGKLVDVIPTSFIPCGMIAGAVTLAIIPMLAWKSAANADDEPKEETKDEPKEKPGLKTFFKYGELWALIGIVFLISMANSYDYTFMPNHFLTMPGGTSGGYGLCVSLRTVMEVPVLFFLGKYLQKYGIAKVLLVPAISSIIHWLCIILVPTANMVIWIQLLHGFGSVVWTVSMTNYVADTLPHEMGGMAQNIVTLLISTVPNMIGGVAGGFIIETLGFGYMGCLWVVVALCVLATAALFVLIGYQRRHPKAKAAA